MRTKIVAYADRPVKRTRHSGLGYEHRGDHWRIVTLDTASGVGPYYATERELLSDLDRFAADNGF